MVVIIQKQLKAAGEFRYRPSSLRISLTRQDLLILVHYFILIRLIVARRVAQLVLLLLYRLFKLITWAILNILNVNFLVVIFIQSCVLSLVEENLGLLLI